MTCARGEIVGRDQRLREFGGGPRIPLVAVDKLGKMVEQGHLVIYCSPDPLIVYEVVDVRPVLNPGESSGRAMKVTLQTQLDVQCQTGVPSRNLLIIGETQARIQARAGSNGQPEKGPSGIVLTDVDDGGPGDEGAPRDLGDVSDPLESGRPCGCDPSAGWVCEQHRAED